MSRLLCILMIIPILFCSQSNAMENLFDDVKSVEIYKDGQVYIMNDKQQSEFDEIFCYIMQDVIQEPAFTVRLDELTKEEMKSGYWVKFIFEQTLFKSEMPFDELLFNVSENAHGVNIIRGNGGVFQGRCYYLNLKDTMDLLYNFIDELTENKHETIEFELENQEIKPTMIVTEDDSSDKKPDNDETLKLDKNDKNNRDPNLDDYDGKNVDDEESMTRSQKKLLEQLE